MQKIVILENEKAKIILDAKQIVLNHLEKAIEERDSATVAAMAEILKI